MTAPPHDPFKVFVGQLDWQCSGALLQARLAREGCSGVEAVFMHRRGGYFPGKRAAAFVRFSTPWQAQRLVALSGSSWPEVPVGWNRHMIKTNKTIPRDHTPIPGTVSLPFSGPSKRNIHT